jgi:hypothetical protein
MDIEHDDSEVTWLYLAVFSLSCYLFVRLHPLNTENICGK